MFIKKWESFSTNIELGPKIYEIEIVGPFPYDDHKLRGVKSKVLRIEARYGGKSIASSNYFDPNPQSNSWDSYLLGVKEEFRKNPEFLNLAIFMRLITFGILERRRVTSQDFSESGMGFVKKWEKLGIWTTSGMSQTLTDWGINQSEKLCREFLNIQKINWK